MPEQQQEKEGTRRGGGGYLTQQLGPMPVWAWMLITVGLAIVYYTWRKNKAAAAATTSNAAAANSTQASQTPAFIIQNYPQQNAGSGLGRRRIPTGPTSPPPPGVPPPPPSTPPSFPISTPGSAPTLTNNPVQYRVQPGDNLTKIAALYHTTPAAIWAYNVGSGPSSAQRPASTVQTLLQRTDNDLVTNELIYIPPPNSAS